MSPRALRLALVLTTLACAAVAARATTVFHMDTPALVRSSSGIVIGRVNGTRSFWNERRTAIVTEVTLSIGETLKGVPAPTVTITQPGGEVDGVRYEIPGSPAFRPDEEVLIFLWTDREGRSQVNGLAQGKFDVRTDPASGERVLSRPLPGLEFRDVRSLARPAATEAARPVPLKLMLREIHRSLEEAGR